MWISPFTQTYPRLTREQAEYTLRRLDNCIVLDTETTGIGKVGELCEIAIVDYQTELPLLNTLIKPVNLVGYQQSKAREVHGISLEELEQAPTLPQIWNDVIRLLKTRNVITYNADFDIRMIRFNAYKQRLSMPILHATCAMKLVTAFLDLDYWLSLAEALDFFGLENLEKHRAMGDTLATIALLKTMQELIGIYQEGKIIA